MDAEVEEFKSEVIRRASESGRVSRALVRGSAVSRTSMSMSYDDPDRIPEDDEDASDGEVVRRLRNELEKVRDELKQSQDMVRELENRNLEMKNLEENPNVAIRQIVAVERRLKVTEDRLSRERRDRASKLSDVEEKLINDNARLESAESELKRKLSRECNRVQSLEKRVRDLREENEALTISLMNSPPSVITVLNDDGTINKVPLKMDIPEYRKGSDEWKKLLKFIQTEEKVDQTEELIHRLWYQKDAALKQLVIWERQLDKLGSSREEISASLQDMAKQRANFEQRLNVLLQECEDLKTARDKADMAMKEKLARLVREKHESKAQVQLLEDKLTSMQAERDALKWAPQSGNDEQVQVVYKYIDRPVEQPVPTGPCPKCEANRIAEEQAKSAQNAPASVMYQQTAPSEDSKLGSGNAAALITMDSVDSAPAMVMMDSAGASMDRPRLQQSASSLEKQVSNVTAQSFAPATAQSCQIESGPRLLRRGASLDCLTSQSSGSSAILDEQIMMLNQDLDNNRKKVQLLKSENTKRQKELLSLQNELTVRIKEQRIANEMNQKLLQEKAGLKQKVEDLEKEIARINEEGVRKSKELGSVNFKYTQLEDEFKASKLHLHKKIEELTKTDAELMEVKQTLVYKESAQQELGKKMRALELKVANADMIKDTEIKTLKDADEKTIYALRNEIDDLKVQLQISEQNANEYREEKQKLQCELIASGGRVRAADDRRYITFGSFRVDDNVQPPSSEHPIDYHDYRTLRNKLHQTEATLSKLEAENARLKEIISRLELSTDSDKDVDTMSMPYSGISYGSTDAVEKLLQEREVAEARYAKTLSQLKSAELSLSHGNETREQLRNSLTELERAVDLLKTQVNRETAARKEAERKIENLLIDLNGKAINEDQVALHKANLLKAETDVVMAKKTADELNSEVESLKSRCAAYETELAAIKRKLKEKTIQYEHLHAQYHDAKKGHETAVKALSNSYSSKLHDCEKESKRREYECKQLKNELRSALDKLSAKSEEILKLKEDIYSLQDQLSSSKNRVSPNVSSQTVDDVSRMMDEIQNLKLEKDELVTAVHDLRNRLAKETSRSCSSSPELKSVPYQQNIRITSELKSRLDDLESRLQTEKRMHDITQKQLKNIWEDNDSLRQRLIEAKRSVGMNAETRVGSRLDEINTVIARSQVEATYRLREQVIHSGLCSPVNVGGEQEV